MAGGRPRRARSRRPRSPVDARWAGRSGSARSCIDHSHRRARCRIGGRDLRTTGGQLAAAIVVRPSRDSCLGDSRCRRLARIGELAEARPPGSGECAPRVRPRDARHRQSPAPGGRGPLGVILSTTEVTAVVAPAKRPAGCWRATLRTCRSNDRRRSCSRPRSRSPHYPPMFVGAVLAAFRPSRRQERLRGGVAWHVRDRSTTLGARRSGCGGAKACSSRKVIAELVWAPRGEHAQADASQPSRSHRGLRRRRSGG